ncbi:hypothetical protein GP486_008897, partial [Trichoglossum hirsutum]
MHHLLRAVAVSALLAARPARCLPTQLAAAAAAGCAAADWVPSPAAWAALGVDNWIQTWWNGTPDKSQGFVKTLAAKYMLPDTNSFACSVHRQCAPSCQ